MRPSVVLLGLGLWGASVCADPAPWPYPDRGVDRSPAALRRAVARLAEPRFRVREQATARLYWAGLAARDVLRPAAASAEALEARVRARRVLARLDAYAALRPTEARVQAAWRYTPVAIHRAIPPGVPRDARQLVVWVDPDAPAVHGDRRGLRVWLINGTRRDIALPENGVLVPHLEALDTDGRWRGIERAPRLLPADQAAPAKPLPVGTWGSFTLPRYAGPLAVRMRVRVAYGVDSSVYAVSNYFNGRVHPTQLWLRDTPVRRGLLWLKQHQSPDGRWDVDGFTRQCRQRDCGGQGRGGFVDDVGVTALAVLGMLGDGQTHRRGELKQSIKAGLRWLMKQQQSDGSFGRSALGNLLATTAMAEAYRRTRSPLIRRSAKAAVQRLVTVGPPAGPVAPVARFWRTRALQATRGSGLAIDGLKAPTRFEPGPATGSLPDLQQRYALAVAHAGRGGEVWERSRHALATMAYGAQLAGSGDPGGSWAPACRRGRSSGRVYSTAMMILILQQVEGDTPRWARYRGQIERAPTD